VGVSNRIMVLQKLSLTYLQQGSQLLDSERQTDRDRYENSVANLYAYGQKFYSF